MPPEWVRIRRGIAQVIAKRFADFTTLFQGRNPEPEKIRC
jgi:hypothetical protein